MPRRERLFCAAFIGLLCACSGGGPSDTVTTIPQANSGADSTAARNVNLGSQPTSVMLPVVSQITGVLLFPAVGAPATVMLSATGTAPSGVVLSRARQIQSGTLTIYEYITIAPPKNVTLPSIPAMTFHYPVAPIAGKAFYYGISDLNAQGGLVRFDTQGPGAVSGQTVSFAKVPTPITLEALHKYTFAVYATTTAVATAIQR